MLKIKKPILNIAAYNPKVVIAVIKLYERGPVQESKKFKDSTGKVDICTVRNGKYGKPWLTS